MSIINNGLLLASEAAGAGGYQVSRSLRFNSSDSAYLSRTPASAGNRKTWTFSCWLKRSALGLNQLLFGTSDASFFNGTYIFFENTDLLRVEEYGASSINWQLKTSQVFRDPSSFYHLVVACDTTQGTAANRVKIYVNGVEVTALATASYPSSNADTLLNTTAAHGIGRAGTYNSLYFNGYLAECYLIDGQQLTPSSFTEVSATTGQLIPKAYTGSYGTNGFKLTFSDNSGTTSTTLGKDAAGSNNWTPNNFSVASGSGNDSLVDTPTSVSATDTGIGGEIRGNYCTLNPLNKGSNVTLANGNLESSHAGSSVHSRVVGTVGLSSGKWYYEATLTTLGGQWPAVGVAFAKTTDMATYVGAESGTFGYYGGGGVNGGGGGRTYSSYTTNDVIGVAIDLDNNRVTFYKNGANAVTSGTTYENLTAGEVYVPAVSGYGSSAAWVCNFGQRAFAYTAPSGFKALCDTNLPAPVIAKPNTVMDVITYTGTGSSLALPNGSSTPTSISFTPDFAWIKGRSGATDHALYDAVRGVQKDLVSNSTSAETTETTGLTAFGTNTFTVGSLAKLNTSSSTYVAWAWNAGGSTVTNTQGSITSSVRANASAGFSIITYTGNGSSTGATVGHGLGVEPSFFIIKNRSASSDWVGYHKSVGSGFFLILNSTSAAVSSAMWDGAPSSTVLKLNDNSGGTFTETNTNGQNYVAYCFAPVAGYSAMGSFSGGSGIFTYTGFRPKWLLIKQSSAVSSWIVYDTSRDTYNVMGNSLYPNLSDAEISSPPRIDFVSNGFVTRAASGSEPSWTGTVIYFAVAESPFNYARAR